MVIKAFLVATVLLVNLLLFLSIFPLNTFGHLVFNFPTSKRISSVPFLTKRRKKDRNATRISFHINHHHFSTNLVRTILFLNVGNLSSFITLISLVCEILFRIIRFCHLSICVFLYIIFLYAFHTCNIDQKKKRIDKLGCENKCS